MSKPYRDQTSAPAVDTPEDVAPVATEAERDQPASQEAARLFADLFSTIAHDLRSPLSTITASASILGYDGVSEADRIECASYIMRSVQQMKEVLEQACDVVELEARRESMELEARPLAEIVQAAREKLSARAERAGVAMRWEVDDELRVACNEAMLTRAFELLTTACVQDSGARRLGVRATKVDDTVHVEFVDDGDVVSEDDIPRLFDRFWERDRGCRPKIGLAMRALDQIVRQHQGAVTAEAAEGGGMRFVVSLPAATSASVVQRERPGAAAAE